MTHALKAGAGVRARTSAPLGGETMTGDPTIITFGCRLNTYESEVMRAHARGRDDAIIVNTCAVTSEAVRQARQAIRKARREHPDAEIIVTGCAAQIDPDAFAAMPEVSRVLGNAEKLQADSFHTPDTPAPRVAVGDIMSVRETASHLVDGITGRARGFVEIQNGCDHRCTFCVIPYGRGNSRSVPAGVVVDQVRRLVENGTREVVLTGVDLTSYGSDLPGRPPLGQLVRRILKLVPELARLRLSSLDTIEIDPDLMRALAEEERLMPHLHLSLQAGDDMILKRMKRRHLTAQAEAFCRTARDLRPDVVFGADIIAGFPTETEAMFANTLAHVEACGLTHLHVFPFSPREGTPAARMPPVAGPVIKDRAARLRALGAVRLTQYLDGLTGTTARVLMETPTRGRTEGYAGVAPDSPQAPGSIVTLRLGAPRPDHLLTGTALAA